MKSYTSGFFIWLSLVIVVFGHPLQQEEEDGSSIDDILKVNDNLNLPSIIEGDVMRTPEEEEMNKKDGNIQNGLVRNKNRRWKNKELHFVIDGFNAGQKAAIRDAVNEIMKHTCIKLTEHPSGRAPSSYVRVYPGSGCWSYVGQLGGKQDLSLQSNGCVYKGTIMHEFLHALGVQHEQSRADRDQYVEIMWNNIQSGLSYNFDKEDTDSMGVEYDPKSVMHYSKRAFSRNGGNTIEWKANRGLSLGGRDLTALDIKQLNLFYECDPITTKSTTTRSTTTRPTRPTTTEKTTKTTTTKTTKSTTRPTRPTTTEKTTKTTKSTTRPTRPTTTEKTTTTMEPGTCGDKKFICVRAYWNRNRYCNRSFYKRNCKQSCKLCESDKKVSCVNFKDMESYECADKAEKGFCTTKTRYDRYYMKKYCPKTCCMLGRLYW